MLKKYLTLSVLALMPLFVSAEQSLPDPLFEEREVIIKDASKFDWIRLKSGEWLKGELKSLYDKEVEFESDILDTLIIDKEDIYMVISERMHSARFNDGVVLNGKLDIAGGFVNVGGVKSKYRYSDLISIAPSTENERNAWTVKFGIGANISKGNTDQEELSAKASVKRRTASSRFLAEFLGYRTTNNDEITENNIRTSGTFDWFYTQEIFFRPIFFEYNRDPFQNIANKYTVGAGVGYYLIDTDTTELDFSAGPAYQKTEFDTVAPNEQSTNSSTSFFVETNYEHELTKKIDLNFDYRYTFAEAASGGDAQHAMASVEIELTDDIDFDVSVVWDYLASPIADSSGIVPEKEDYKMIFSLGIDL
jgi:putative salt-induced outer membrane protein YdiY